VLSSIKSLWGNADHDASIGDILGPSFAADAVPDIIEEILNTRSSY
jgi:sulfite reductase (NADPH) hemoprotein beta-component